MAELCPLFDDFVVPGDVIWIERGDAVYQAVIHHDQDSRIDDTDCWNPDQDVTGCDDEQQAELLRTRKAWFDDEWHYVGVEVTKKCACCGHFTGPSASLWGIEANLPGRGRACSLYLSQVAEQLIGECE